MQLESATSGKAIAGLRLIGYSLLIMSAFDIVDVMYPLQMFNSGWEFETVGNLIERVGFPMIGFGLVFVGEGHFRSKVEPLLLKPLSWLLLVAAIAYWLLIPVGISAAWRVHNQNNAQMVTQLSHQREKAKVAEAQLTNLSDEKLKELVQRSTVASLENFNAQTFRQQQIEGLQTAGKQTEIQAKAALEQQDQRLLKRAVKWSLGALIAGGLFVYLWHLSAWARMKKARSRPMATVR